MDYKEYVPFEALFLAAIGLYTTPFFFLHQKIDVLTKEIKADNATFRSEMRSEMST